MLTSILKRIWCKTCNEFELHDTKKVFAKEWFCNECDTEYTDVLLSKIPKKKLIEQRKRYKIQQTNEMNSIFNSYMMFGLNSFNDIGFESSIKESDAGQRKVDERLKVKIEKERKIKYEQKQKDLAYKATFHKLGRNEKCLCGSNLKYKKCCLSKIQKL